MLPGERKVTRSRADRLAVLGLALAAILICWPLLARPNNVPPPDGYLGGDLLVFYSFANVARTTALRFGQFPLRSPWHGGGHPAYVNPDDITFTPTMLLVLAIGPWAAIKVDLVVTMMVGGLGMFLLTRRKMGYPLVAALFSATAFAFGGLLLTKWLLGWHCVTRTAWLPLVMYALWRGQHRRRWLALAAGLAAWFVLDQKYVVMVMGWFLLTVGLLRLDEEEPAGVRPAWGYFGRVAAVWAFGAGLAALKVIPMLPLLLNHLRLAPEPPSRPVWWHPVLVWLVISAALGLTPLVGRLVRNPGRRLAGAGLVALVLAAVAAVAVIWVPPPHPLSMLRVHPPSRAGYVGEVFERTLTFGTWQVNEEGVRTPVASDRFLTSAPVGPVVGVLAVAAVILRPRKTWKWAILTALFLIFELSPALPLSLAESWGRLPLISWMRRPTEPLHFYWFFLLTLLAGRALDWPRPLRRRRVFRVGAWILLAGNLGFLGWNACTRFAYSVSRPLPEAPEWGPYELAEEPKKDWRDRICFLVRGNIGLKQWYIEFRDRRHESLEPSLFIAADGTRWPNLAFRGMVRFEGPDNQVKDWTFTPNEITVRVKVQRPGVLLINQINDRDWHPEEGKLASQGPLLRVRLSREGEYAVRLRYVPTLLYLGLLVSALTALGGAVLLVPPSVWGRLRIGRTGHFRKEGTA